MKTLFEEYHNLWPEATHASLKTMMSDVNYLLYPEHKQLLLFVEDVTKVIIIINDASVQDLIFLVNKGFEHIVQRDRKDFAQELLVSALMAAKPKAFVNNPIPFFFSGFQDPKSTKFLENNLVSSIKSSSEKRLLIEKLYDFLQTSDKLKSVSDVCLQIADELITNAIYASPAAKAKGYAEEVTFTPETQVRFFCCYSEHRVIIGCEDQYGTFKKSLFLHSLKLIFNEEKVKPKKNPNGGAGLGFKYLIENSANIYLFSQENKRSLVACGLDVKRLRDNLSKSKNLHFSFT